ncbi:MAG: zinc ribbon domain-containing protein [Pirellulaceae bacterium]|nr:zinc ribbon domain-containing protein [Pirellulaceae bacterium]
MIVIGTWDWPKTIETGIFYCPACDSQQNYRRRRVRPFLTLYFIPVIPIGRRQEQVQCRKCKSQFETSILGDSVPENERTVQSDLIKAAALTILEDQHVTEPEIVQTIAALQRVGGVHIDRAELGSVCSTLRTRGLSIGGFLWSGRNRWSRDLRLMILQIIFLAASAEGQLSQRRLSSLLGAGRILELSESEIENCIEQAEQLILGDDDRR